MNNPTVLVIESNETIRNDLKDLLGGQYDFVFATTMVEATSILSKLDCPPAAIVMDLCLPDSCSDTSLSLIPMVKKMGKGAELVAYSDLLSLEERSIQGGACSFVFKREDLKDLTDSVHHAVHKSMTDSKFKCANTKIDKIEAKLEAMQAINRILRKFAEPPRGK